MESLPSYVHTTGKKGEGRRRSPFCISIEIMLPCIEKKNMDQKNWSMKKKYSRSNNYSDPCFFFRNTRYLKDKMCLLCISENSQWLWSHQRVFCAEVSLRGIILLMLCGRSKSGCL